MMENNRQSTEVTCLRKEFRSARLGEGIHYPRGHLECKGHIPQDAAKEDNDMNVKGNGV